MTESDRILVFDDVLVDPHAYRAAALARAFTSVDVGAVFHGIAMAGDDPTLADIIVAQFPALRPTLTFFRQSPEGQVEPNFIHDDCDMGAWTAILYLTIDPPEGDGTAFWRHTATGSVATTFGETTEEKIPEVLAWRDLSQWTCWHRVPAAFNRIVLFPAPYYHSRALAENYGRGASARLTQVLFGLGDLPVAVGAHP
jgi:hypothetical protein